jgi:sporulation protein YlmC with PRC-barrel domain
VPQFELCFGRPVVSSDGRTIGNLERLVVEEEGFDPHSIIVREADQFSGRRFAPGSWYFHDEMIVPVANVVEATEERVVLNLTGTEVRRLHPYLSYKYRPVDAATAARTFIALGGGGPGMPNVDEIAAKSSRELEIDNDEKVMLGHTGQKLGNVREVLVDDGELIGIVIDPKGFFNHDVQVPVRFLGRSDDMALFVDATNEDIEKLRPIDPKDD